MTTTVLLWAAMWLGAPAGQDLFEKRCSGCHELDKDKAGPRLRGVFGRKSGTVTSFPYSEGLKKAQIVWDADALEKWITDPEKVVPDTDMSFRLDKADERRAIVEFLKSLPPGK